MMSSPAPPSITSARPVPVSVLAAPLPVMVRPLPTAEASTFIATVSNGAPSTVTASTFTTSALSVRVSGAAEAKTTVSVPRPPSTDSPAAKSAPLV